MTSNKPIIITDPYPRTMDILFSKENLKYLKKNFTLIKAPKVNKKKFYKENLSKVSYIFGQPDLPTELIKKNNQNSKQYLMWKAISWIIWIMIIVLKTIFMFLQHPLYLLNLLLKWL
jgi:hypothetical protein